MDIQTFTIIAHLNIIMTIIWNSLEVKMIKIKCDMMIGTSVRKPMRVNKREGK
jgi:hypothetical protein